MPNTRHNKYVSVTDWFATPPTSSQTGSVQQSVSRPSPLTGGGGGGNWGSTAVPPSSGGYSLEEIQYIVETYGSGFFLRKDRDDTANGVITFNDLVKSNDFAQGNLMGAGWSIYRDGNNSVVIETDRVIVRKDMTVSELIVNQETFLKGSTIYVKAGCTLTGVEDMGTYYRCYYDNKDGDEFSGFVENDLARCLRYDKSYALVVKYYWRKVVGVGDNYVDLSKIDGEYDGVGIPEEGDDIAQLGNTEDKTRQSAVVISPDSGGSVIIWAGINSFSLSEKNMVGMGVDSSSGKAYIYGYGDLYFGDRNQEQFINYSPEDGLHINGTLSIGTKFGDKTLLDVIDSATPDGYEEFVGNVTDELNDIKVNIDGVETSIIDLQKLLDGAIETWFYEGIPTLENAPAFNWTTDELKNAHLGDLYYNKTTGKAYRFQMDGTVYLWVEITDTDIQAAMQAANAAQDTADNKRRVFITTPYPPYDKGDLWSRGSEYPLMICVVPKESGNYVESDWDYADNLEKIKEELEQLVSDTTDDLNNAIGQATEAANKYADEGIEGAKSSLQSSINALNEAKANANDVYTKAEADGIINQAEEDAILAAKQQADAAIALSEEIIKAYADGIVDEEEEARIKQAEENLQAAKDYADQKANEAFAQIAGYEYLKKALKEDTTIEGGLIQTSLLKLGYTNELGQRVTMSGTNGVYNSNAIGGGVASWWGGDIYDLLDYYTWDGNKWNPKSNVTIPTNIPSGLVRFDGTGYFAKGNLWWEEDGTLHADPSALFLSFDVNAQEGTLAATILNIESTIAKFSDMWEIKEDSNGNEYLFAKRSVVTQGGLTQYADTSGLNIDGIYDAIPIDGSTIYWDNGVLKAQGGGGGITSITKDMVVEALGYTPYDASNPNGYITSAALDGYLPLSGGTISGTLAIKNSTAHIELRNADASNRGFLAYGGGSTWKVSDNGWAHEYTLYHTGNLTSLKNPYALSWSGYSSGSYDGSAAKSITIPSNTNQLTNGAGFITSSASITGNAATASLIKPISGTYQASTWNPLTSYTKIWGEAFINSAITSDSGDMIFYLRPSIYNSGTTELCIAIDGDFYAQTGTKKVWHEGNLNPSNYLPLSGGTITGNLFLKNTYFMWQETTNNYGGYFTGQAFNAHTNGSYTAQIFTWGTDGILTFKSTPKVGSNTIWHSGNDGSGSGLDADTLDGWHHDSFVRQFGYITSANTGNALLAGTTCFQETLTGLPTGATSYGTMLTARSGNYDTLWQLYGNYNNDGLFYRRGNLTGLTSNAWKQIAFTDSNVASATKLTTARKIWGQSFDGTGNIESTSDLKVNVIRDANNIYNYASDGNGNLTIGSTAIEHTISLSTKGSNQGFHMLNNGNVGIGTVYPTHTLSVRGGVSSVPALGSLSGSGLSVGYTGDYGIHLYTITNGRGAIQCGREDGTATAYDLLLNPLGGNVGIGNTAPAYKLDVSGSARLTGDLITRNHLCIGSNGGAWLYAGIRSGEALSIEPVDANSVWLNNAFTILQNGNIGIGTLSPTNKLTIYGNSRCTYMEFWNTSLNGYAGYIGRGSSGNNHLYLYSYNNLYFGTGGTADNMSLDSSANLLVKGGITQYSDIRKKTKLQDVELTLKQVANAPLIEHYYNSDDKKTTHVGSIAQYWAEMNDWFCKLDSDGFYTMEIQNAALASAISIARELERYESKTDKKIRMLKKRINELEDEIEKLKSA